MIRLKSYLLTSIFLLLGYQSSGQADASLKPETINISKVSGRYMDAGVTLIIKKKNKYKSILAAPRPLVSKGTWEIHDDTLVLYETHRNTNIRNEGKNIKGKPIAFKFIMIDGKMYSVVDKKRILFPSKN
jgi:hypothetical protein